MWNSAKVSKYQTCGNLFQIGRNNQNQRQTAGFGSLWPLLTWWRKFRRVAETSFCKQGTTWVMWSPVYYRAKFRRVDISCKSSGKQSESTPNRIRQLLAFADMMREVFKTCRNLVLQRGDHMSHVVPPLLSGQISTCGYLLNIEWETIGINAKQQDLGASGLS